MSYLIAAPEYLAAAATDLSNIGTALGDANSAALGPVSSVLPAGADEVSASIAVLFGAHAQAYAAISAAAQAFHAQFVQLMSGGAEQYLLTEAANATPLNLGQGLLTQSTAGSQALTTAQPLAGSAVSAASAGSAPAAAAGLASSSAPVAPVAPPAVATASSVPSALVPVGTSAAAAQAAAPTGSTALAPATTAEAAVPAESQAPSVSGAPASATTSVAAAEADASALSPVTGIPPVPLSGTSLAAAATIAPPAAAGPASTSSEQPAVTAESAARAE
jgi:hypothetical protein